MDILPEWYRSCSSADIYWLFFQTTEYIYTETGKTASTTSCMVCVMEMSFCFIILVTCFVISLLGHLKGTHVEEHWILTLLHTQLCLWESEWHPVWGNPTGSEASWSCIWGWEKRQGAVSRWPCKRRQGTVKSPVSVEGQRCKKQGAPVSTE